MISADTVLSLLALLGLALVLGAAALWRRQGFGKQTTLMLILAAVIAANIAIWVSPGASGKALVSEGPK
ncbi:MAG: hypothetical protein ABL914_10045 [Novosphingobium sp.]|uniref:hypothetical protein n=1 Tax=Novosphingobium sp. TaxID=1874826 RepID=UPI0032B959F4